MFISKQNYRLLGATMWLSTVQYYFVQIMASLKWSAVPAFSWLGNTISDLGNTECGLYGDRPVCSPLHDYMNASFILLGITQMAGAWLLWNYFSNNRAVHVGLVFMMLAGLGTVIVGLYPENSIDAMHVLGAALPFTLGNVALILNGIYDKTLPTKFRRFSLALGLIAIVALGLFLTRNYLGLQIGGMERIIAYPQSIWMIVVGFYILRNR